MKWFDGIVSLYNDLANRRSANGSNAVVSNKVTYQELNEIFKSGLGNKIVRIKAGYALKSNNIIFDEPNEKEFYLNKLQTKVKEAFKWSLVFGRGIIVINDGGDLSLPLEKNINKDKVKFEVFSGDMVSVVSYETDLMSDRYYKPQYYNVRGYNFHYSRVVDFSYIKPTELDLPTYNFGGISEFELIYNQIVNDGVVERASASIIEKNSSLFYKIQGFKQALATKQEDSIVKFYSIAEDRRSIYGAGLIDKDDDVVNVSQNLSNLSEVDNISLRRVAMVTGIPLPMLIGENVKGLNSAGQQEKTAFNEMIENIQQDYILPFINQLLDKLGMDHIKFKDNQNVTALEKAEYETKVLDNATKIYDLGYDVDEFLKERGIEVKSRDEFESEFSENEEVEV